MTDGVEVAGDGGVSCDVECWGLNGGWGEGVCRLGTWKVYGIGGMIYENS